MDHGSHEGHGGGMGEGLDELLDALDPDYAEPLTGHSGHGSVAQHGVSGHSGGGHEMKMWFHGGYQEVVLFSFWKIHSIGGLVGSMLGIFLLGVLYEGFKVFREYLSQRTCYCQPRPEELMHRCHQDCCSQTHENHQGEAVHIRAPNHPSLWRRPCHWGHWLQSGLHMVQVLISYFLMLIFMTYNVYLCLAVVLGAGVGFFLFAWRRPPATLTRNEHCN